MLSSSPGIALLAGAGATFGHDAIAQIKLHPRWLHTHFWQDISEEEHLSENGERWSHADLVSEQISRLATEADARGSAVVVAVSGHHDAKALSLMLGVIKASGLKPVGLIDAAILECACLGDDAPAAHLDIHLNQAVVTHFSSGATLKRTRVDIFRELGWTQILDNWSEWFARRFVEETRFDPHHGPEAEQGLLDQLLKLSGADSLEDQKITLKAGSKSFALDVPAEAWSEAGQSTFTQLKAGLSGIENLALSAAARMIPGLLTTLSDVADVVDLPSDALTQSFERHRDTLIKGAEQLSATESLTLAKREESQDRAVTHLLLKGQAWPIGDGLSILASSGNVVVAPYDGNGIHVYRIVNGAQIDPRTNGTLQIDGNPAMAPQRLEPGITLTLAGCEGSVLAIHELSHGT